MGEELNQKQAILPAQAHDAEKPRVTELSEKRDVKLAVILAVICILFANTILTTKIGIGASVLTAALLIIPVCYLWKDRRAVTPYGLFCCVGALGLCAGMAFSGDNGIKFFLLLGIVLLGNISLIELMCQRAYEPGTFYSTIDIIKLVHETSFGNFGDAIYVLFHAKNSDGSVRKRRIGGILIGLLCALPALFIIVPLLISSDAAFEGMIGKMQLSHPGLNIASLFLGALMTVLLFALLFFLPKRKSPERTKYSVGILDPVIVSTFLAVVSAVYLLYLFSQTAYFFSAFRGLLPDGYSVANYARRGFFEMCGICVLNLLFVFLSSLLCRKKNGRAPLFERLLSLFLCLFSLTLVAISISKMVLYIQRFGMTRLRILTSAFMLLMAAVFLGAALRQFSSKLPYLKLGVVAATVLLTLLCFANVDRVIASYNVDAYLDGRLSSIDMYTLLELSDAKVPSLVKLLDVPDQEVAEQAGYQLLDQATQLFEISYVQGEWRIINASYDLRGFNYTDYVARKTIIEHWNRLSQLDKNYRLKIY